MLVSHHVFNVLAISYIASPVIVLATRQEPLTLKTNFDLCGSASKRILSRFLLSSDHHTDCLYSGSHERGTNYAAVLLLNNRFFLNMSYYRKSLVTKLDQFQK